MSKVSEPPGTNARSLPETHRSTHLTPRLEKRKKKTFQERGNDRDDISIIELAAKATLHESLGANLIRSFFQSVHYD